RLKSDRGLLAEDADRIEHGAEIRSVFSFAQKLDALDLDALATGVGERAEQIGEVVHERFLAAGVGDPRRQRLDRFGHLYGGVNPSRVGNATSCRPSAP